MHTVIPSVSKNLPDRIGSVRGVVAPSAFRPFSLTPPTQSPPPLSILRRGFGVRTTNSGDNLTTRLQRPIPPLRFHYASAEQMARTASQDPHFFRHFPRCTRFGNRVRNPGPDRAELPERSSRRCLIR